MIRAVHSRPLSEQERRAVDARLAQFERSWNDNALTGAARDIAPEDPLATPLLIELARADLRQRRRRGLPAAPESYLEIDPRLAEAVRAGALEETPESLAPDEAPSTRGPAARRSSGLPEYFGRYRILRKLGSGGMSTVFLAHDSRLERPVALKVPRLAGHPDARDRFFREARAASVLSHPNLCPVFDVDEVDGVCFLTMPYIEGRPLSALVRAGEMLPQRQVAALVRKLALAMQEAHAHGVVHRDLKPSNVMLTPRREPVIMDFGLAHRLPLDDLAGRAEGSRITSPGQVLGTPAYMPPEQACGDLDAVGPRSDVYSLGAILYELLTGHTPYAGPVTQVLSQLLTRDPEAPSLHRPDLDRGLEAVCQKAMARRPEDRYESMERFAAALSDYLNEALPSSEPRPARPPSESQGLATQLVAQLLARLERPAPRRRGPSRWLWGAAALAVVALVAGAAYYFLRGPDERRVRVRLGGLTLPGPDSGLVFVLNGEPVDPRKLEGKLELPVGTNELIVRRGGEEVEHRVFELLPADHDTTVTVPPDLTSLARVRLEGLRVDADEDSLDFLVDGREVCLEEIKEGLPLRRGLRELVVKRDGEVIDRVVFVVAPGDEAVLVPLRDLRRIEVRLELPAVLPADPRLAFKLDGRPVAVDDLRRPLRLFPGTHVLTVIVDRQETRQSFRVRREDRRQPIRIGVPPLGQGGPPPGDRPPVPLPLGLPSEAVAALLPLTTDQESKVRREAAVSFGKLKDRTAVPVLCKLLGDDSPQVRRAAAESLDLLGDPVAAPALRRRVEDEVWCESGPTGDGDPSEGGKAAALAALRRLAPDQVTEALAAALRAREGPMRRWAARELMRQADARKAVPALRRQVAADNWYRGPARDDRDPEAGGKADALKLLRELAPDEATEPLTTALSSRSHGQRRWAADELAAQHDRATVPALRERVVDDTWDEKDADNEAGAGKSAAFKALKALAPGEARAALIEALRSKEANVRQWAVKTLADESKK